MARPRRVRQAGDEAKAQRLQGALHRVPDGPTPTREPPLVQLVEDVLRERESDFTCEQIRHGAVAGALLVAVREDQERFVAAVASVVADYERALDKARRTGAPEPTGPTLADVEATQRLAEFLKGEVEECRAELFGAVTVPFGTMADAAAWVARESEEYASTEDDLKALGEVLRGLRQPGSPMRIKVQPRAVLLQQAKQVRASDLRDFVSKAHRAEPDSDPGGLGFRDILMDLAGRSGYVVDILDLAYPAGRSKALGHLADEQDRLAEEVGVTGSQITRLILLDIPPVVQRWEIDVKASDPVGDAPLWFSVEMRDSVFSNSEVAEIFRTLRLEGLLTSSSLRDKREQQRQMLKFARERRDFRSPPMSWTDVVAEWNDAYPSGPHYHPASWHKALRKAREAFGEPKPPRVRAQRRTQPSRAAQDGDEHRARRRQANDKGTAQDNRGRGNHGRDA